MNKDRNREKPKRSIILKRKLIFLVLFMMLLAISTTFFMAISIEWGILTICLSVAQIPLITNMMVAYRKAKEKEEAK